MIGKGLVIFLFTFLEAKLSSPPEVFMVATPTIDLSNPLIKAFIKRIGPRKEKISSFNFPGGGYCDICGLTFKNVKTHLNHYYLHHTHNTINPKFELSALNHEMLVGVNMNLRKYSKLSCFKFFYDYANTKKPLREIKTHKNFETKGPGNSSLRKDAYSNTTISKPKNTMIARLKTKNWGPEVNRLCSEITKDFTSKNGSLVLRISKYLIFTVLTYCSILVMVFSLCLNQNA